ncbi:GspE/PulE family protein [Benzoatithermus flavus]|uniref:GspE/PulE family protein n=1 Tax=Benzoatithermus flavus TaxID=3108223 RepID=A0ABU8XR54_9PROT
MAYTLEQPAARGAGTTALEDPRTRQLDPVLARLVLAGRISADAAVRATAMAQEQRQSLAATVASLGLITSQDWAEAVARHYDIELVTAEDLPREPLLADAISPRFLRNAGVLPVRATADTVWLAMSDPGNTYAIRAVAIATQRNVVPVIAALEDLQKAYARYWDAGQSALQRIVDDIGEDLGSDAGADVEHLIGAAQEAPVVRLVNQLLTDALRLHASDIHIEPAREHLRVRYRVHGRLREAGAPPARLSAAVISRIKILAKLDIAERRLPQDGRARLTLLGRRIDLRVATAPSVHGESLVIRILDQSAQGGDFPDLGLDPAVEARLKRVLAAPHGMLLVTGPTGSGKTTTLYAALRHLNKTSDKLISIEDPIEYQIDGITQIQVRPEIDLDFARVLRSVVRHDPDVVMVGETRDPETAEIAVHAALTGHLLLTTLHTNSAAGAVARLLDMGVEPYLLASVLRGILGQRLVGVLCPSCKRPRSATAHERAFFTAAGIEVPEDLRLFEAPGCEACENVGFVGRQGIFEFLEVDEPIRELIRSRASTQAVAQTAMKAGMRTMYVDGLYKCLAGITTLDEVCSVTSEDW